MTVFFAAFYGVVGLVSFVFQIFAGSRIVDNFGVGVSLLVLPLALLGGTGILLAFPLSIWAGSMLKGSDGVLRYSLNRSTLELLYIPIPPSIRAEVKAIIDMVLPRMADGLDGVLLLALTWLLKSGLFQRMQVMEVVGVGVFNALLISLWVWVAVRTRREYLVVIQDVLISRRDVASDVWRMIVGPNASVPTICALLASPDEEVVLRALGHARGLERKD
jgi:ATP/ADP translocase